MGRPNEGQANRFSTTLDVLPIKMKHVTYFYDHIGMTVTRQKGLIGADALVFALQASP